MTSSEEDLLSSDIADVEEQLAQSASSVNTDEGTDDDIGKIINPVSAFSLGQYWELSGQNHCKVNVVNLTGDPWLLTFKAA